MSLSSRQPQKYRTSDLSFLRLSSIDTKYHVWKMGVVFTDNVSGNTEGEGIQESDEKC